VEKASRWDGPWWETGWGIAVASLAIIMAGAVIITVSYYLWQNASERRLEVARREQRRHELELEEQRSVQADAAGGNVEFLKALRS
jgi:hypothetical protein